MLFRSPRRANSDSGTGPSSFLDLCEARASRGASRPSRASRPSPGFGGWGSGAIIEWPRLEKMLVAEESHTNWIETQLELIKQIGEANYLAQHMHDEE